jgi:hypothetical protein
VAVDTGIESAFPAARFALPANTKPLAGTNALRVRWLIGLQHFSGMFPVAVHATIPG